MVMLRKQLLARDAKRDIGAELLLSARQLNAGLGKVAYRIKVPSATTLVAMAEAEKIIQTKSARFKSAAKTWLPLQKLLTTC
jgi:hypothetical protein